MEVGGVALLRCVVRCRVRLSVPMHKHGGLRLRKRREELLRRTNVKNKAPGIIEAAIDPFDVHVGLLLILVTSRPMNQ